MCLQVPLSTLCEGGIVHSFCLVDERLFILECSASSDGAGFFSRGNQSWGPYTAVIMNLPPALRGKFAVCCYLILTFMLFISTISVLNHSNSVCSCSG